MNTLEDIINNQKEYVDDKKLIDEVTLILSDEILLLNNIIDSLENHDTRGACMVLKRDIEFLCNTLLKYLYDE